MCGNDEHRCCCLETNTALDTNNRIAHVTVTANGVSSSDFFDSLNGSNLIIVVLAVDRNDFALLKANLEEFGF